MIPKEKAEELYLKYIDALNIRDLQTTANPFAKQCALIAIDEVKWFHKRLFYITEESMFDKYLQEVKQEIENI